MAKHSPEDDQQLGFLAHLYELRDRLLRIVIAVGIFFLVLVPFAQPLYDFLAHPLASQMPEGEKLLSITPAGPFLVPIKLALLAAFLVALPYVLHQVWAFVAPGLYQHEKRLAVPLLISSTLLFYCGIAFAYFVLLPLVFNILPQFTPSVAVYMPDIGYYMDFVMALFLAFGIGFEMPVATILLIITGMSTREDLAKKRPYVIVGAFIVGMLLTPPDVISQLLLAIPMWLLFEAGLVASVLFKKQVEIAGQEKEAREAAERAAAADESSTGNMAQAAAAGAPYAAGSVSAAADNASSTSDASDSHSDEDADAETLWEDEKYIYEEDIDPTTGLQYEASDAYRPLTDEEMEAELARIEAEEAAAQSSPAGESEQQSAEAESDADSGTNGTDTDTGAGTDTAADDELRSPEAGRDDNNNHSDGDVPPSRA